MYIFVTDGMISMQYKIFTLHQYVFAWSTIIIARRPFCYYPTILHILHLIIGYSAVQSNSVICMYSCIVGR